MPEIQITSQNYNGKTVDVIFYSINNPEVGVSLGTYTVPFIYSSPDCFGVYELYPSEYEGKMCEVVMNPTPTPTPTVTPTTTPNLIARDSNYYDNILLMHFDDSRTGTYDPYGDNVSLLMRMDGANNSTSFVDSSINKKTITAINNAKLSSNQSKSGGASAYFDGGSMLSVASSTDFDLGNVYTVEAWILSNDTSRDAGVLCRGQYQGYQGGRWDGLNFSIRTSSAVTVYFWANWYYDEQLVTVQNALVQGQWTHVAVVRNGTNGYVYINGVLGGSISNLNSNGASSRNLLIGRWDYDRADESGFPSHMYFDGYIDDVRITKGIARYDSNFTPPSAPLPPVLPLFKDSSAYDNNLIVSSAVITSNDSKFGGYSGYFNGSSFVRSAGTDIWQLGTDDFTIESWINPSSVSNRRTIVGNYDGGNGGWALSIKQPSGGTPTYGPEVSFTKTSGGSEVDIIIPGALEITRNYGGAIYNSAVESYYSRYLSPTNTSWNDEGWTNVCNYASRTYYDWLSALYNAGRNPGYLTGLEMLMKHNPTNRIWLIKFSNWQAGGGGAFAYTRKELLSCATNSSIIQFRNGDGSVIEKSTSSAIPTGSWSHIAAVRTSGVLKLFLDGTQVGSDASFTSNITRNNSYGLSVGATILSNGTSSDYFSGYLDDLRITKGTARYNGNFSVPTKAFADYGPASTVPSEPLNLAVSEDQGTVYFSWNKPTYPKLIDTRAPVTNYAIEYSNNGGSSWTQAAAPLDDYYDNVVLFLQMNGSNNGVIFNDYSKYNKPVSVFGDVKTTTSQSKFNGSSAYFDKSGDYLRLDNSNDFDLSNIDWTIEMWIRPNGDYSFYNTLIAKRDSGTEWEVYLKIGSGALSFYNGSNYESSSTPTSNVWNHVAAVRYNGTITLYLNGSSVYSFSANANSGSNPLYVGTWNNEYYGGYMSDVRVTKGFARYTSNFDINLLSRASSPTIRSLAGLASNSPYAFRVKAQNSIGFGDYSNIAQIIVPQTSPTILSAIPDDSQAYISWDPPASGNSSIRDYAVQYSANGGASWTTFSHSASTNTLINVTGLNNASNYIFRVAAVNFAGTGVYSDNSSSITIAPRIDSLHNKTRLLLHLDSNQ